MNPAPQRTGSDQTTGSDFGLGDRTDLGWLGPIADTRIIQTGDARALLALQVELPERSPRRARALAEWVLLLEVRDTIAGKFHASDRVLRLNLRGLAPDGTPVVVIAPYDERRDAEAVAEIQRLARGQQLLHELVTRLIAIETRTPDGA
ncbi:hypothetical protein K1T35_48250 (plasmid) [Pseudonocardia sp. DSM 110487]|uniref:hypothetical protein n=1 Tax=Pseudonocardia sp. DSM 110487 TaxID=2865833 RepID=UPI001C6A08CE|nr:hypothetical protein [Pseudonocardia sp. DSM 110487]QYN41141.1 hypothetical protein K1T35_48250 [Pseudonocardia sp. DSM 110487]